MVVFFVVEVVANDDDADVFAELGGGHSGGKLVFVDFFPVERGFDHFFDNIFDSRSNFRDLFRGFTETGVGGGDDFDFRH